MTSSLPKKIKGNTCSYLAEIDSRGWHTPIVSERHLDEALTRGAASGPADPLLLSAPFPAP